MTRTEVVRDAASRQPAQGRHVRGGERATEGGLILREELDEALSVILRRGPFDPPFAQNAGGFRVVEEQRRGAGRSVPLACVVVGQRANRSRAAAGEPERRQRQERSPR